ncbi:MAG: (d)CMP kinase [Candidatus Berkiella sp.]
MKNKLPVITVDGPSGSGKGTLSRNIANALGWHFLDSGSLYRLLALAAMKQNIPLDNHQQLVTQASLLDVVFANNEKVLLDNQDVTTDIRTESCAQAASKVAAIAQVRTALLERQRAFLKPPGLVADGRDMGTIVFPLADLKIFLDASAQIRAKRRQEQLKDQGVDVSLDDLLAEISARDLRDRQREVAPLVPAGDAIVLDSTAMSIDDVFDAVMAEVKSRALNQPN